MTKRRLTKAFGKLDTMKKTRDPEVMGVLGFTINGVNTVEVGNRSSYVWVRLRSNTNEVIQAFNDQISPVYGLPVVVVRDETDRNKYRIKGKDLGVYQSWNNTAYLPRHGNQHSFNPDAGGGGDVTFIFNRQFMPLAVHPSGTSGGGNVYVQPYAYYQGAQWKYAGGTGTASLFPYKPTGTSARMVLVYLDNDGNPQLLPGSTYFASNITGNAAVLPYVPTLSATTDIPLAAIRLVSGTSTLVWDNIYDLRPLIVGDGFVPTGTVAGHEIQDDGVPLTQQPALNFVGSNFSVYNTSGVTNVSGSFVGGGGGGASSIAILDDNVFQVSGTAISFDKDLSVSAIGATAHIDIPAGTFASGSHTHPAGEAAVQIFDNSVFKATGTAISFDTNLTVAVTGTVAYVNASGAGGYTEGARVYRTANFNIPIATGTVVDFDSELWDTDNIHSGSSTQLYCNTAGMYLIHGQVQFASNVTAGWRMLHILLNSTTVIAKSRWGAVASVDNSYEVSTIWQLNQNDYVELFVTSNVALAVQATGTYAPHFMMQRIG